MSGQIQRKRMKMNNKDYEAIARILRETRNKEVLISELCYYFREDNPAFKKVDFVKACRTPQKLVGIGNKQEL